MIPSSTCSSVDPVGQCSSKQPGITTERKRGMEGGELKQVSMEKEKHVIVNNYYITDREQGWKQLERSEIPPNILENKTQRNSNEISPGKSLKDNYNEQSEVDKEVKNLDRDRRNTTQAKTEPKGFYGEGSGSTKHVTPANIQSELPAANQAHGKPGDCSNARVHMPAATHCTTCVNQQ